MNSAIIIQDEEDEEEMTRADTTSVDSGEYEANEEYEYADEYKHLYYDDYSLWEDYVGIEYYDYEPPGSFIENLTAFYHQAGQSASNMIYKYV